MAGSPTFFGEGSTPRVHDTRWRILQKILGATIDQSSGGGGGPGTTTVIRTGHGAPDTPGGTVPMLYIDLDCDTQWIWDPDGLVWTQMDQEKATGKYTMPTVVELAGIPTLTCPPVEAHTFGNLVQGDEQAAWYRFDPDSLAVHTGMSVIQPNDRDVITPGRWLQVVFA